MVRGRGTAVPPARGSAAGPSRDPLAPALLCVFAELFSAHTCKEAADAGGLSSPHQGAGCSVVLGGVSRMTNVLSPPRVCPHTTRKAKS